MKSLLTTLFNKINAEYNIYTNPTKAMNFIRALWEVQKEVVQLGGEVLPIESLL